MYKNTLSIIGTGFALFSMFFGAGNLIFPLTIGQIAGTETGYATLGLLVTSVGVPLLGMAAMILFHGDYRSFFDRLGKVPSRLLIGAIIALLGPFGAMPRCIAFSYGNFPDAMPFALFSGLFCLTVFLLTYWKMRIVDLLGYILTPLLIVFMVYMIIKGLIMPNVPLESAYDHKEAFLMGLKEGYQTMDLLAALFFSSIVIVTFNKKEKEPRKTILKTFYATLIGLSLLALSYLGLSMASAQHASSMIGVKQEELFNALARHLLGSDAALISAIIVMLACLTTVISIGTIIADYINDELSQGRLGYGKSLGITLFTTFGVSLLKFSGIKAFILPLLTITYPALIVLCFFNIAYRLWAFRPVKVPFMIACLISLIYNMALMVS